MQIEYSVLDAQAAAEIAEPAVGAAPKENPHQGVAKTASGLRQMFPLVRTLLSTSFDPERRQTMLNDKVVRGNNTPRSKKRKEWT
jgi:hypothetical protein